MLLTNLATGVTIATPVATIVAAIATGSDVAAIILAIYTCLLATYLLYLLISQEKHYHRDAHYGPAMEPVQKAFSNLAAASWTVLEGDGSEEAFLQHLRESLRHLAQAFSLITDNSCRASIKIIDVEDDGKDVHNINVTTLCRSHEDVNSPRGEPARIDNNTDFKKIFDHKLNNFFSNDLPAQIGKGYRNSNWTEEVINERSFDYRAAIVWPIGRTQSLRQQTIAPREIIGFLCVDTLATNVFNETHDVPLGAAFAEGLHLALRRFRSKANGSA